ncbi:helix-turn-helix domain-containing protein [Propionivibrio sp.]|uniref:helix-turn-helix domain-containing protein n=1 Tax=Propionivibrio sp. TaxID=2212460 RepID=UPI003BF1A28E
MNAEILSLTQAAEFLQVSEDILLPMVQRGEIPAGKVRSKWRLVRGDLIEWIRSQYATKPTAEIKQWPISVPAQITGGSQSAEYAKLLGLPTKRTPRRLKQS